MNESDIPVILGSKIGVQSTLSSKDKRGWVTFHWGPMSGRLTPDMAREHAFKILACAQAAQTDEMLWRFAHEVEEKDAMMLGRNAGAAAPGPRPPWANRSARGVVSGVVDCSLQTADGYARVPVRKHLAPGGRPKSLAAKHQLFARHHTRQENQTHQLFVLGNSPSTC